jgi:nitrate/nitrite transporter NarK
LRTDIYLQTGSAGYLLPRASKPSSHLTLTVTSTFTRFLVPVLADRMGSKIAMGASFFMQTFPVLILPVAQDPWGFYLFTVLFGVMWSSAPM